MKTWLCVLLALGGTVHCAGGGDAVSGEDDEINVATDASHLLFVGKWASATADVPKSGPLPFETNIRSLEFKDERADSSSHTRFRLAIVVRPDCSDCKDESLPKGTYRSIADSPSNLKKGKLFTTEGGNTSSRDFYEIDGNTLRLTATNLGAEGRTVTREFKRVSN